MLGVCVCVSLRVQQDMLNLILNIQRAKKNRLHKLNGIVLLFESWKEKVQIFCYFHFMLISVTKEHLLNLGEC